MNNNYLVREEKIITVSSLGSLYNGAIIIKDGRIASVGNWNTLKIQFPPLPVTDFSDYVVTPFLDDCHTHLLGFASSPLYPVTKATHLLTEKSIFLHALRLGITVLGEQICGYPIRIVTFY